MKVLMVFTSRFHQSGITNIVLRYYRELIKKDDCNIDFIVPNEIEDFYKNEFKNNNSNYFILPGSLRKKNTINYIIKLKKIMKKNKYDIVHIHGGSAIMAVELLAAKLSGINIRIVHCHSVMTEHKIFHNILYPLFNRLYTNAIACTQEAGEWLFKKKKFLILNNGLDINKFEFNINDRKEIRKSLGISDNVFLIGNVGIFNEGKNQSYLIKILPNLLKDIPNCKMIFIGGNRNNKKEEIIELSKKMNCYNKIIFVGSVCDVSKYYSAMDCFVFPSKYEGFGIAVLEAQISGLKCICSTAVPKNINICNNVEFFNTEKNNLYDWIAEIINEYKNYDINNRKNFLKENISKFKEFDITYCSNQLYSYYKLLILENKKK